MSGHDDHEHGEDCSHHGHDHVYDETPQRVLTPAAQRALAEAAERRAKAEADAKAQAATEYNGPKGPEPTRYGDWERKGIASDF